MSVDMESVESADWGAWPEEVDVRIYADGSMTLPGQSERPSGCGEWMPMEFCSACGEPHFGERRCGRRICPDCWGLWAGDRTEGIVRRLAAARYVEEEAQRKRAVHTVASPPEESIRSLQDVYDGFRDAYRLAEHQGVRGGVAIFHGYRVKDEVKRAFRELSDAGLVDGGVWRWIREQDRDWRSLTYWSPHYHIVGLAEDVAENKPDEQDGWVFERLRSLEAFRLSEKVRYDDEDRRSGWEDMAAVSRYLLSHATFETDSSKDCVRWFGSLARTKFRPEEELSEGSLSVIERKAEEVAHGFVDGVDEGEGSGADEGRTCDEEDCEGRLKPIWEAGAALVSKRWCNEIGRETEHRLAVAFEWAIGEIEPPPGLKRPRTEEEAREAFETLL